MTTESASPARSVTVQPWAIGLVGVVVILLLLVGLTL